MKFSIVTPSYNMDRWIAETIESVLAQEGDFEIEYLLQDGGSSDKTVEIFDEYKKRLERGEIPVHCKKITMEWRSEKDAGTFDAINKGFAKSTGDLLSWCDADNTYAPGAFAGLAKVVQTFPEIEWLKGYSSTLTEEGKRLYTRQTPIYHQQWLREGIYGRESYYVTADTVFWTKKLWERSGPIPTDFRCAGEQWLWIQMAAHVPLWAVNLHITNYRKRAGQLSSTSYCKRDQLRIRPRRTLRAWLARFFFSPQSRMFPRGEAFFLALYPLLYGTEQYVDFISGVPVKKQAKTFIIGENPSYADMSA